jgi:dipeptidyl aminopeptidase/acylaminoacyl peptidase
MIGMRHLSIALVSSVALTASPGRAQSPAFTFEDMLNVETFAAGQPIAISRDGNWIAYVSTDLDDEWNLLEPRPTGHLVVQRLDRAGAVRMLTAGPVHASFPVWSPDGKRLAFYREEASGARLTVWNEESDEMTPLGDAFTGRPYLAPQWVPSGERLVFAAAVRTAAPEKPRVQVVESTDARIPGDDFFVDHRTSRLFLADFPSRAVTPLLPEPALVRAFRVSAEGRDVIYVVPEPSTFGVIGKERNQTFQVALAVDGSASPPVSAPEAGPDRRIWSPDGSHYVRLVPDPSIHDPEIEPDLPDMYTIATPFMDLYLGSASSEEETNLTAGFPDQVSDPVWSPDGRRLFFKTTNNETYDEAIRAYLVDERRLTSVAGGAESYDDLTASDSQLLFTAESAESPPDLYRVDLGSRQRSRLTDLNPQLRSFRFSRPEMFSFWNADGDELEALLYRPVGQLRDTSTATTNPNVPVITWIYEKLTPGIHRFNARQQVFLNHGYALLLPNVKVRVGETGTSFVKAVVPAVNKLRDMGFENSRFALWGHSFGAYATSYVITQTDVFACAVSGATPPELFRNWASGRDRDSRNIERGQARMGGSPFEFPERYLSQSAFFQLDKVHTPVLILHGEKDLTILFGEGEMMFYALRQLGKEATFVAYRDGDHSLSRHSRADTLDVNRRIFDWFEAHLKSGSQKEAQP